MTTQNGDETPIERPDGPDATDVPETDPSGRVDDEDLEPAPDSYDSQTLPLSKEDQ